MKKIVVSSAVCLMAVAVIMGAIVGRNQVTEVSITNWGLSFQNIGSTPIGNDSAENLEEYDAYFVADEEEKIIYLTFDAGYENGYTAEILDTLKEYNVSATFFLVGNYLETAPDLVQRMVDEGHTVGNHTYNHLDMSEITSEEAFAEELQLVEEKFYEITGEEMVKLYRPPQGSYSEENLQMAQELGYTTVFWSLAYVDWYQDDQPTSEEAFDKLIPRIHNGSIILLHSTSSTNAEILGDLITQYQDLGYTFGSLEDYLLG